jgi:transposase
MPLTWYGTATTDSTLSLGPLAVFWPVLERMHLRPILEQHLPTDPQAEFSHAAVLQLLIAARLSHPVALVNVAAWAAQSGAEVLSGIPAAKLNDDRLGRALDAFFAQRHSVLASVALHVTRSYGLSLEQLHYDPTHLLLHGAYQTSAPQASPRGIGPAADGPAHITFGYPATETKLLQAGVCSLVDRFGPLPLFGHLTDGNHNGHTAISEQFALLQHYLRPRDLLLVSDRGTFAEAHIAALHRQGFYALCAAPWSDFRALWREHHERLHWQPASYLSREQRRRRAADSALPREQYELAVLRHTLTDPQTQEGIPARLLFVFSSADQKVARKTRQEAIERIRTGLEQITRSVAEGRRGSDPAAVSKRIGKLMGQRAAAAYFRWELLPLTTAEQAALPPPGRGCRRPSHRFVYHFDPAAAERDAEEDGYAVLVTTAPLTHSGDSLFSRYKNQNQVELVHRNWKKPLAVHPLFLHNPERVEALVYVLLVALMAYYLTQRLYRQAVPADAPEAERYTTTATILRAFRGYALIVRSTPQGRLIQPTPLNPHQRHILQRLGLPSPAQLLFRLLPQPPP